MNKIIELDPRNNMFREEDIREIIKKTIESRTHFIYAETLTKVVAYELKIKLDVLKAGAINCKIQRIMISLGWGFDTDFMKYTRRR